MKFYLLLVSLIFSSIVFGASSQIILLDENFQTENIQISGPTFYNVTESYVFTGTCYRNEPYEYTSCHSYHDSSIGEWVERCETVIRVREVSYDCLQQGTRQVPHIDGGSSETDINVNLKNATAIKEPIEFNIKIDQSNKGLGRKILFSAELDNDSLTLIKKLPTTQIKGEGADLFIMKGQIDLEAIDVSKIKEITNKDISLENVTTKEFVVIIPSVISNLSSFRFNFTLSKKGWFKYIIKDQYYIQLNKLKTFIKDEKTFVKIPFSQFPYFKKQKTAKYSIKATLQYSDDNIIAPTYYDDIIGNEAEIKFKANFKTETIDLIAN